MVEKTGTAYLYCNNSPVMLIDPTGMKGEDPIDFFKKTWNNVKSNVSKFFNGNVSNTKYTGEKGSFELGILDELVVSGKGNSIWNKFKKFSNRIIKWVKNHVILELKGKADIGVQGAIKVGKAKVGVGVLTKDIGAFSLDLINSENTKAEWGDNTVHNYGELSIKGLKKENDKISLGGKIDYNYKYDRIKDDGFSGVDGTESLDWNISVGTNFGPGVKDDYDVLQLQPKTSGKLGNNEISTSIGIGAKVLIGLQADIK